MKYEVLTTEQAAADLRAIFEYIAYDLLAGQNALNQLDRLEQATCLSTKCRSGIISTIKNRGKSGTCASCP